MVINPDDELPSALDSFAGCQIPPNLCSSLRGDPPRNQQIRRDGAFVQAQDLEWDCMAMATSVPMKRAGNSCPTMASRVRELTSIVWQRS